MKNLLIIIVGEQGAGKTTLANAIASVLNEQGVPTRLVNEDDHRDTMDEALNVLQWMSLEPVEVTIETRQSRSCDARFERMLVKAEREEALAANYNRCSSECTGGRCCE